MIICLTAVCVAQDETTPDKTPDVAPVTSYVAVVGEKLVYDARLVTQTGEVIACEQHVTLQSLQPEIQLKLQAFKKADQSLLEETVDVWKPTPDSLIKDIIAKIDNARITPMVVDNKRFRCLIVTMNNHTLWLVLDDDNKHVYPGVLKVSTHQDGQEIVILELKQIIQPAKK